MNQENQSEEIDLMQVFGMIKDFFRKFLRLIISIVSFYKKKWVLFLILGLVGGGLGFFMDQYQNKKNNYQQEIIIAPKYNSVEYIYDFIEDLEDNFKDEVFVNTLGLDIDLVEDVKKIVLEPIIQPMDVLNELKENYGDKESFIEVYDEKLLEEKKYRNFYKQHRLTITFKDRGADNNKITKAILEYIKSNSYFKEVLDLELKQTTASLDQNRKSLQFINEYLTNLSQNPSQSDQAVIFASESEIPTISSLIRRKDALINQITEEEKTLALDKEIFTIVAYGDIISKRKILINRRLLVVPFLLIGLVSVFFLFRYISREALAFVNSEQNTN